MPAPHPVLSIEAGVDVICDSTARAGSGVMGDGAGVYGCEEGDVGWDRGRDGFGGRDMRSEGAGDGRVCEV